MQNNPCIGKWQLALNAIEYIYSSARFYLTGVQGIYPVSNFMEMEENLYNGNIRAMVVNIPQLGNAGVYGYRYDQLNRIKGMNSFNGFANATNTLTAAAVLDYRERVTYDPNGNIRTYIRNGNAARFSMDSMTYTYKANNNQLDRVVDAATDAITTEYSKYNDLKRTQPNNSLGQATGNYQYDAIGNLISDVSEGITNISWSVYGKIQSITKTINAVTTTLNYGYDASGNRISKAVAVGSITTNTIYVRDASSNIMAVYTKDAAINSGNLTQTEISMYGSSRLGVWNRNRNVATLAAIDYAAYSSTFRRGCKGFELTNHLGNVLVTVSDKRVGINDGTYNGAGVKLNATLDNFSDYFVAEVVTANDYYPFGMTMPGRKYSNSAGTYRYGFNGKENDNEVKGEGNQQDYGMRIYDPRLGRFLSVDPLSAKYSMLTPYQFASNRPIDGIDLDGAEYLSYQSSIYRFSTGITNINSLTGGTTYGVVLMKVYENIPTQLQNPQTCDLKFTGTAPIKSDGTDYNPSVDPIMLYDKSKYYHNNAEFYGASEGNKSSNGINALNGNAIPGMTTTNGGRSTSETTISADNINSIGNIVGKNGLGGMMGNMWNYMMPWSDQAGINEEGRLHRGFTSSVNAVDGLLNNGIMKTDLGAELFTPHQRASLINFVADGSLNPGNTKESIKESLNTAWYGVQIIIKDPNQTIRTQTRQAIGDVITKYKEAGGGNEYDNISQYYDNE